MAIRSLRYARSLFVSTVTLTGLVGALLVDSGSATAAPHKTPSISSVQKRLGHLALQNDQLVEKFNQAQMRIHKVDRTATAARQAAQTAARQYRQAHVQFVRIAQAQYEGEESFGAAAALMNSNSGSNYLDRLATLNMISSQTTQVVETVTRSREMANAAAATANHALAAARTERDVLAQKRKSVQKQIDKYRSLLDTLTAAQRAAYTSQGSVPANSLQHLTTATSAAARRAVDFALKQVGKPYVFGAAGPGAWDCSGLTMGAWQHGGVSLPHSAADQYNYGHHVSRDNLEPGDLVFFYQPIGHVTIYIGDGLMVSAPTEGMPVQVVPLSQFNSDYTGATRLTD